MRTNRRGFIRLVGLGAGGAICAVPLTAWADRIRVLGDGGAPEGPSPTVGQISPDFQRFVAAVSVGEASDHGGLRVFWLYGLLPAAALAISTLEEARSRGDLLITEHDQASVPELIVENRGKSHVLLLAGEILLGGKQNRVLTEDILLPPGSGPRNVGVYCVEQGRWSGRTKEFDARGSFAAPSLRSRLMERADQGRVWAEVRKYARSAGASSPTQSYQDIYEKAEVKKFLEGMVKSLNHGSPAGAMGAATFVGRAMLGLDLFADPGLFAREWPKLLRAHALEAYLQQAQLDPDGRALRGRVEGILRSAAKAEGGLRPNPGVGRLFAFRLESLRGSALVFDGRVVHAAIL